MEKYCYLKLDYSQQGKTTQEIKSQLLEKYKDVIINPVIEVSISIFRPISIYIGGEVNRPGLYNLEYKEKIINTANNKNLNLDSQQNNSINFANTKNQIFLEYSKII